MSNKSGKALASLFVAFLLVPVLAAAQEHPKEHQTSAKRSSLTKEELAGVIENYVRSESKLKGGYFLIYDAKAKKPLVLLLDKVHKDRLSKVGKQTYFACADFKTPEGKLYDLDVFMEGPDKDHLQVTEISVHKEGGMERYTWAEKGGIWKKVPIGKAKEEAEHPSEHPSEHPEGNR